MGLESGNASCGAGNAVCLRLSPAGIANKLCAVASSCIVLALVLTHFNPRRFRIHPIPYLSDAGIRDPERIIISFGLSVTGALFLPIGAMQYLHMRERSASGVPIPPLCVPYFILSQRRLSVPVDRLVRWALPAGLSTSFFLALFTSIPGIRLFHHVFAVFFAASAAVWCSVSTMFAHACAQAEGDTSCKTWHFLKFKYFLCLVQILSWVSFGVLWLLLKLGIPWKLVPNTDGRFVCLALFEYCATSALLCFIRLIASNDLGQKLLVLSLESGEKGV